MLQLLEIFFLDRVFYLKQLHSGKMETLGVLKLVREDRKNGTIEFETVGDGTGALPRKIVLAKNLPEYEEDFEKKFPVTVRNPQ